MQGEDEKDASETASAAGSNIEATTINRVGVKVPPFWPDHAEVWLAQVEAQFAVAGIVNDSAKFNTVVAAIESNVLVQVSDAILNPPENNKYANLKKCIVERYCESEQKKTQKLLSEVDLGDKRPTQLLNELSTLSKDKVTPDFLKSLWMQRLPAQVRAILQASDANLAELAKLADKIMEVGEFQNLAAISTTPRPSKSDFESRLERIEQLINSMCDVRGRRPRRSRSTSSNRKRSTDSSAKSATKQCWYHRTFGEKATKCREPCSSKN